MIDFSRLKKISEKAWFYPVALLLVGFVIYGYVLPSLGYYWDDWEIVMFTKLNPALQFNFFAGDRPFPWTYQLTYFLVGSNPIGWHIVTLFYRWAGVLLFVYALILLWPRYEDHLRWLGALILVYPGFLQQSQSATKARHIATFFLFALSVYLMILAVKRPKWARFLFPLSWLTAFAHLSTTEYFAGLELLRPVLLWMLLATDKEKILRSIGRVVVKYIPYLLILVFYFWCRIVFFPVYLNTMSHIGNLQSLSSGLHKSLVGTTLLLFDRAFFDLINLTLQVWISTIINFDGLTFQNKVAWFAFGLGVLLTVIFAFFQDVNEKETSDRPSPASVFVVGFFSFIVGALPIWAIGKEISAGNWSDRYSLAPLLGACLMVMALLLWFVRPSGQKIILSFLLVFSIAAQVWVVYVYRLDCGTHRDYYCHLAWRAPALQPGTALFSWGQPSTSVTQFDEGFALNILYHYRTESGMLPYLLYTEIGAQFDYKPGIQIRYHVRNLEFDGNTSESISVLHHGSSSCLGVLDPIYTDDPLFFDGADIVMPVSNPSRIIPDPKAVSPDPNIFGLEPAHRWCYFFEKADLARQTKDWNNAITLYEQSKKAGYAPNFGAEYIPFIEAYAQVGDWQKAYDLTLAAQKLTRGTRKMLCANWLRLSGLPSANTKVIDQVKRSLKCTNF